jgi:hypothetical protein
MRIQHHGFLPPQCEHRIANRLESFAPPTQFVEEYVGRDVLLQLRIPQARLCQMVEAKRNLRDNKNILVLAVESASTITELAFAVCKMDDGKRPGVQRFHFDNRFGNLLPVRPDVLDWSGADQPGYAGKTLDACKMKLDAALDKRVPHLARRANHFHILLQADELNPPKGNFDYEAVKTFIVEDGVAAAAENVMAQSARTRKFECGPKLIKSFAFDEVSCLPS